ncbi:MAG: hypothetical protein N2053_12315, partial [Chitinispirillaceae bacterium]|nr:hypothetical protein [Chitinispirillaceae bacterium]
MHYIVSLILIINVICFAEARFFLVSELRTNYGISGSSSSFTNYYYDSEGNRLQRRVFDGIDTLAPLMSKIFYSYDSQKRCTLELLMGSNGDTLSMVRYLYGSAGVVSASTLRKEGSVRFKDSLIYSGEVLVEQRRYDATEKILFYRRYGYSSNLLTTDTLFEPNGSSFSPTQIRVISYNSYGRVSRETQWRITEGQLYQVSTTEMKWYENNLISATKYETDGAAKRLIDSLAWSYDNYGNRIKEEYYDNERVKVYEIIYNWRERESTNVTDRDFPKGQKHIGICWCKDKIEFGVAISGSITLLKADGRKVSRQQFENQRSIAIGKGLSVGKYIA